MNTIASVVQNCRRYVLLAVMMMVLAVPSFAQSNPPAINLDVTQALDGFFDFFVQFFNAFAPIILPIAAIPAAIAFVIFLGALLKGMFSRLGGIGR